MRLRSENDTLLIKAINIFSLKLLLQNLDLYATIKEKVVGEMPQDWSEYLNSAIALLAVLCTAGLVCRLAYGVLRDKYAPVKTAKAQIVDKYVADQFSKIYSPMAKRPRYYIVFAIGDKRRAFRVSELSYGGYKLHKRGTLKYKGSRLVDFS